MPSHPATIHHNPEGAFGLKWFQQGSHPSFGYQRGQDMVVASDERQTGSHNSPMQPQLQNQPPRSSARVSNPITPSATDTTLLTDGRTINQGGQKSNNVKKANRGSKPTIRGRKKRSSAWDSDPSDTELANMEQSLAVKRPDDSQPSSVVSNVPTLATSKETPQKYDKDDIELPEGLLPADGNYPFEDDEDAAPRKRRHHRRRPDTAPPPRPENSFLLFRSAASRRVHSFYNQLGVKVQNAEVSRLVAKMWRVESNEVKQRFQAMAQQKALEHHEKYRLWKHRVMTGEIKEEDVRAWTSRGGMVYRPGWEVLDMLELKPPQRGISPANSAATSTTASVPSVYTELFLPSRSENITFADLPIRNRDPAPPPDDVTTEEAPAHTEEKRPVESDADDTSDDAPTPPPTQSDLEDISSSEEEDVKMKDRSDPWNFDQSSDDDEEDDEPEDAPLEASTEDIRERLRTLPPLPKIYIRVRRRSTYPERRTQAIELEDATGPFETNPPVQMDMDDSAWDRASQMDDDDPRTWVSSTVDLRLTREASPPAGPRKRRTVTPRGDVSVGGPSQSNILNPATTKQKSATWKPRAPRKRKTDSLATINAQHRPDPNGETNSQLTPPPTTASGDPNRKPRLWGGPPRPPNQFVLYRRDKHKEIVISHFEAGMTISNIEISKLVGKMWQQESAEVKAKYAAMQKEEARKHAEMYPGYKYAPRKMVQRRSKRDYNDFPVNPNKYMLRNAEPPLYSE